MIRFGILGCGRIGQVHARTLHRLQGATVTAVADALPKAAQDLAAEIGAQTRDIEAIIAAPDIDAVAICTPTDTHADLIEAAARAGKPIFCEKPIDLDADRVRACLDTVEAAGVPLLIGFNRRFDPHFAALRAELAAGKIGTLEQIVITSRDPAPPPVSYIERSGGLFRDMMIHDFDMARFLLGGLGIERVMAIGAALVDPAIGAAGDIDTATVVLQAEGGVQVVITNSRRACYGYDQRAEAFGSAGMLQVGNQLAANVTAATAQGIATPGLQDFFMERYADAYAAEMRAFMEMLRDGTPPPVSGIDGLEALRLADAAAQSMAQGGWVSL